MNNPSQRALSATPDQGNAFSKAVVCLILGELALALMAAVIKHLSGSLPMMQLVFCRNVFGLMAVLPIVVSGGLLALKTQVFHWHALRALSGVTGMLGYFYVISQLPLAEANLVKLTSPFFLPLVAWLWLKEDLSRGIYLSVLLGFIGVVFILKPGTASFQPAVLVGIGAAVMASVAKVTIRRMGGTEPGSRIVFYFALLCTVFSLIPALWVWQTPASNIQWLWLMAMGLLGTVGQLLMTYAYRMAPPGRVGVYTYSSVIFAALLGWIIWGEPVLLSSMIGAGCIIAAGVMALKAPKGN